MGRAYRKYKRRRENRQLLPHVPSDYLVPPRNPPGFGIIGQEYFEETALITGQKFFDDPFYNVMPPPPFGPADPTFPQWVAVMQSVEERYDACPIGPETPDCQIAREKFFEAARQYSYALDRVYGLNRVQPEPEPQTKPKQKNRT